tara:strand:- start:285 stop:461 length:177 start_codon:yes stop_codon:yes gene_type:complete
MSTFSGTKGDSSSFTYVHKNIYVCLRVDISILVMGDAIDITGYDRKTSGLSNAPLNTD